MKIRLGYISNSSTSSFICGVCGSIEAERDCSLHDFEMKECEHGHIFHIDCNDIREPEITNELVYEKLKDKWLKEISWYEPRVKKYEDILIGVTEPEDYEKNYSKDYFERQLQRGQETIQEYKNEINQLDDSYKNSRDLFLEFYEPIYQDEFYDEPVSEEYCPVCQKKKKMEQDPKYNEYKELFEHFEKFLPSGRKAV